MVFTFVGILFFILVALLAGTFLAWCDYVEKRIKENARPLDKRINSIRDSAAQVRRELLSLEEELRGSTRKIAQNLVWIPTIVNYLRRLEELAEDPIATPQQADELASEAKQFVIAHRLQGIFVAEMAAKLAGLLRMRAGK